jgi:hypothetical protein
MPLAWVARQSLGRTVKPGGWPLHRKVLGVTAMYPLDPSIEAVSPVLQKSSATGMWNGAATATKTIPRT